MLRWITSLCVTLSCAAPAMAESFPSKPVRIVVPYAAGGASDILGRLIAARLQNAWDQPVIVENRAGAGGNIGTGHVAKSAPDGHTLLMGDISNFVIAPSVYPNLPYDVKNDFAAVSTLTYSPYMLLVTPTLPVNTIQELIDHARKHPGELNWATTGLASAPHLAGIQFAQSLDVDWLYLPNKGGAQANTDVMGGQADVMFNSLPAASAYAKSGQLKVLAMTSPERVADFPNVPLVSEIVPGFSAGGWQGILAPAGTPEHVVAKLNRDIVKVLQEPEVQARLAQLGAEPVGNTPQEMQAFLDKERQRWATVVNDANLQL